jgi:hypothetical protein
MQTFFHKTISRENPRGEKQQFIFFPQYPECIPSEPFLLRDSTGGLLPGARTLVSDQEIIPRENYLLANKDF